MHPKFTLNPNAHYGFQIQLLTIAPRVPLNTSPPFTPDHPVSSPVTLKVISTVRSKTHLSPTAQILPEVPTGRSRRL
ncbi:hypothetical protein SLE2022_155810 [Rubroshorea leprosula]